MKRFPDELKAGQTVPAIITIHGGNWSVDSGVTKGYYKYMTEFITEDCGCVHVNMEYRRMGAGGGLATGENAPAPYEQMLEDIQSVIEYLQSHAATYHIDASKIALMGWSAGGHLALLYAYMAKQGYYNYGDNIQLVISEAGPTYFCKMEGQQIIDLVATPDVCNLVGIDYKGANGYTNDEVNALVDASPISYVAVEEGEDAVDVPYTILAYGNGISCPNNEMGDGTVPYSQAQALETQLSNNGVQYDLYELIGVGHGYFDILINNSQYLIMLSSAFSTLKTN